MKYKVSLELLESNKNVFLYGILWSKALFYLEFTYFIFNIYISIDLREMSSPVFLSICSAKSTVFGARIYKFWEVFQYFLVNSRMMKFSFFATTLIHKCKAGSCSILLFISYYDNSIGFEYFRNFIGTQYVDPSFHSTCSSHPDMFLLSTLLLSFDLINPSLIVIVNSGQLSISIYVSGDLCC